MTTVNYFVIGELFSLLERIELIDGVSFGDFDPDDEADIKQIVSKYIEPSVHEAKPEGQQAIKNALAYYSVSDTVPFQLMKDRCQELTLPDAESWHEFFDRVGILLFGEDYRKELDMTHYKEKPDEKASETVFARPV